MPRRRKSNTGDLINLLAILLVIGFWVYPTQMAMGLKLLAGLAVGGLVVTGVVYYRRRKTVSPPSRWADQPGHQSGFIPPEPAPVIPRPSDNRTSRAQTEKPSHWSLDLIKSLDWKRFEDVCAGYFQAKGRKAKVTSAGADGGIDILLYSSSNPNEILGVVQCKAWTRKPVGVAQIRELLGIMTDAECPLGVYVATSGYTPDAMAFAKGKHIKLISGEQFLALIQDLPPQVQADLLAKATAGDFTTPSCPTCEIKLISRTSRRGKNAGKPFWGCPNFPRCRYSMRAKRA